MWYYKESTQTGTVLCFLVLCLLLALRLLALSLCFLFRGFFLGNLVRAVV